MGKAKVIGVMVMVLSHITTVMVVFTADCPKLKAVPVSEKFLFKLQPKDGFYASLASGEDAIPNYIAKPVKAINSSKTVCLRANSVVNGKESMTWSQAECHYNTISNLYCVSRISTTGAVTSVAVQMPKAGTNVLVDTDNETYVAMGVCADGALYEWALLTTEPRNTKVHERTLKALHITEDMVKNGRGKMYTTSRGQILKGSCPDNGPVDVSEVGASITGILGGR